MSNNYSLPLAANGAPQKLSLGQYAYSLIRSATAAAEVSFDGQVWQAANINDMAGPFNPPRQNIYFRASGGVAAIVSFTTSLEPISAQSTSQRVASTRSVTQTVTDPAPGGVVIPGTNNGCQRKTIIFFPATLGGTCDICDDQGAVLFNSAIITQPLALETDHDYVIKPRSGAHVSLFAYQVFYRNAA